MSNLSFVRHVGDGVTTQFTMAVSGENLGYIRTADIVSYVNGVHKSSRIDKGSPHLVIFETAPAAGSDVLIRREVPDYKPYANFSRGNNFGHRQVNNTFVQQLYLTQEILDGFKPVGYYEKQDYNMGGKRITSLGDAKLEDDAVSLGRVSGIFDDKFQGTIDEYKAQLLSLMNITPQEHIPFNGTTITLDKEANSVQVEVDGRVLFPSMYKLQPDNLTVLLVNEVTTENVVVTRSTLLEYQKDSTGLKSYETVGDMVEGFGFIENEACVTHKYKKDVTSFWKRVPVGEVVAGDMTDGTIALNGGGFARLSINGVTSLRAFGTKGDGVEDDSDSIINAFSLCRNLIGDSEDTYLLKKQVVVHSETMFEGCNCNFLWEGEAGNYELEGRDWGVFRVFGSFGAVIKYTNLLEPIPLFTEKDYPISDSSLMEGREGDYILMFAGSSGSSPELPSFSLITQFVGITSPTSVAVDYRCGWEIPAGLSITYREANPVKDVTLKNFTIKDISPDNVDRNKYASAISLSIAVNCHIIGVNGVELRNPVVFGQYCNSCTSSNGRVERPQETGGGQGYHTQWSYSTRCDSHRLSGYLARHICDHTKSSYCNVTHCGDTNTADGAFTNHGAYEHDISYDNCVGWHSIANSGASFGQSCARVNILHGNGSALTCGANVIDLSVSNSHFDRVLANNQGFQADGLVVGSYGFNLVSTSVIQGRATLSKRPNTINNSSLYFGAGHGLSDYSFTGRTLYLNNTELRNINSSLIGTGRVHISGGSINGSTAALGLGSDASLKLTNVDTYSFGVRLLDGSNNSYFIMDGGTHTGFVTTGIYSNRMKSGKSKLEIRNVSLDAGGGIIIEMSDVAGTNEMLMDINHNTFSNGSIYIANRYSGSGKLFYTDNLEESVTRDTDTTGGRRVVERNLIT